MSFFLVLSVHCSTQLHGIWGLLVVDHFHYFYAIKMKYFFMIKYPFRQVGDADKRQKFEIEIVQL